MSEDMIRALLIERAGYERQGRADRAADVTAQLERLGHAEPKPAVIRDEAKSARGTRTTKG